MAESITVCPKRLTLRKGNNGNVTITVKGGGEEGGGDCLVEGVMVTAKIKGKGKQLIGVSPGSQETDANGQAVFSGNQQINPSHVATLGTYTGQPSFDLYCNDSGWFKSGQHFLVEATLIDSSSVKQVIRLP